MDKVRLKVDKDEVTITEGEDTLIGKLIKSKGSMKISTPFGKREVKVKKQSNRKEGRL